jgi:hypothetical protein
MRDSDPDCRRLGTRLRMLVAKIVDKILPGSCWAEWCTWAMGYGEDRPAMRRSTCADARRGSPCWCGKYGWPPVRKDLGNGGADIRASETEARP